MLTGKMGVLFACPIAIALTTGTGVALASDDGLTSIEELGKQIFFDRKLSINRDQACASCHVPEAGWTGDDSQINNHGAVYEGSINGEFGNRKPPSSAYATLSPIFYADYGNRLIPPNVAALADDPLFVGGNFWDGRATGWKLRNPAADQAQGPFLNPVEQALPDAACVVYRVCEGRYGDLFDEVFGPDACVIAWPRGVNRTCKDPDGAVDLALEDRQKVNRAYNLVALSIAAFEGSPESDAFTSRIDAHRAGFYEFTAEEELGRQMFRTKGMCSQCHRGTPGPGAAPPLFTDFTFSNLGVPVNPENPFQATNPDWRDPGLSGFLETVPAYAPNAPANLGKQKVPTLRNVALGSCEALDDGDSAKGKGKGKGGHGNGQGGKCTIKAYMHNGYFKTLKQVVQFYNTRDAKPVCPGDYDVYQALAYAEDGADGCWPAPEVAENVVGAPLMGNLGLTDEEEDALVAFMQAMSDGYMTMDDEGDDD